MRLGLAHHFGWATAVTADDDHAVIDRRRIELIEPGLPAAPIHHLGGPHEMHLDGPPLDDDRPPGGDPPGRSGGRAGPH